MLLPENLEGKATAHEIALAATLAHLPESPGARESSFGPQTGAEIILEHYRALYRPVFRIGTSVRTGDGVTVPMGEATSLCDSKLIKRLECATDAPRYAGKNGTQGEVKRDSLPGFFKKWSRVAWGDLLGSLPDEDTAALATHGPASDEFRQLVRDAMLTQLVLGDVIGGNDRDQAPTQVERRSLIDWCQKFAKPGPWKTIRSYRCWCRIRELPGGEIVLQVAIRHELFGQLRADRALCVMNANTFTRRAERYGIGTTSRENRPHGLSAVTLADDFVADLIAGLPDDAIEAKPEATDEVPGVGSTAGTLSAIRPG